MKTFEVTATISSTQTFTVDAENEEKAVEIVNNDIMYNNLMNHFDDLDIDSVEAVETVESKLKNEKETSADDE